MTEYMTLLGVEDVKRAANDMGVASQEMKRAAESMQYSVDRLIRALDDHAHRIETAMENK